MMRLFRYLLIVGLLVSAPLLPAHAADEAHQLAASFLDKIHIDQLMLQSLAGSRMSAVQTMTQSGKTPEQAGEIYDKYMEPEFKARLPELRAKFEDILVQDFTVPELQAILSGQQGPELQSAAAKAGQLQGQFAQAGMEWGQSVGVSVYAKNKEALDGLGVKGPPAQ